MGAPSNNQFWKLRDKHGRPTLFENPEELLLACQDYFNWVDAHPWYKVEQLKKPYEESYTDSKGEKKIRMVHITKVPTARPYTIQGLCIFLGVNSVWFNQFETAQKNKDDDLAKDFSKICTHVREVIYQQKFEGAAVGAFNANIIARDLHLKENTDVTTNGNDLPTNNLPPQINVYNTAPPLASSEDEIQ